MRIGGWFSCLLLLSLFCPPKIPAKNFIRFNKITESLQAETLSPATRVENSRAALAVYGLFHDLEIDENTLNQLLGVFLLNQDSLKTQDSPQSETLSYQSLHSLLQFYQNYFFRMKSFSPDKMKFFQLFTRENPFKPFSSLENQEHERIYQWIRETLKNNLTRIEKLFSPLEFYLLQANLAQDPSELPQRILWLQKALKISFNPALIIDLVQAYAQNKNYSQAEALLAPLSQNSPLWHNLWKSLEESQKEEEKTASLEKALKNPDQARTFPLKLELSRLYRLNDRAQDSLALLKTFPESERNKGSYLKEKALGEFALGNLQLSEIALSKALSLFPKDQDLNGLKLIILLRNFLFSLSKSENTDYIQVRAEVEQITAILFPQKALKPALLLLLDWIFSGQPLNDREKDIQALEKAYPTALETLFLKAALALHQKRPQEALKSLIKIQDGNAKSLYAAKGSPTSWAVELSLLAMKSDAGEIKNFLTKIKRAQPEPSKQLYLLNANALLAIARLSPPERGLYEKCHNLFLTASSLRAEESQEETELNLMIRNNLGILYAEMGQLKHAFEFFKRARELNPELLAPHLNLIISLSKNKDTQTALGYLENLLQEFPFKDPFEKFLLLFWKSLLLDPKSPAYQKNISEATALLDQNQDLAKRIQREECSTRLLTAGYFSLNPTFTLRKGFSIPITLSQQIFFLVSPGTDAIQLDQFLRLVR